jgi:probable rRNA maturation factor
LSIEVINESDYEISEAEFAELAKYVFEAMHIHPLTELSIKLVDTETMSDYHVRFMDIEGPTDVMSFPMDELEPGTPNEVTPAGMLGDILLCPAVAITQAQAAGHSTASCTCSDTTTKSQKRKRKCSACSATYC